MRKKYYQASRTGFTTLEAVLSVALVLIVLAFGYTWLTRPVEIRPVEMPAPATMTIVDSSGRYVEVPWPVKRVASLSGYAASMLVALGAKDALVGIPYYVVGHPWAPNVTDIGSFMKPAFEAIIMTKPDIVITYVEYPTPGELEGKLEPLGIKVVRLDFYKLDTFFAEVRLLGLLMNRTKEADELVNYWQGVLKLIKERTEKLEPEKRPKIYWEHSADLTACGPGSGRDEVLKLAGGVNIFADAPVPFPKVSSETVIKRNPDVIIKDAYVPKINAYLVTDPGHLIGIRDRILARAGWDEIKAVKEGKVYVFTWELGSDFGILVRAAYIAKWLHPELFKDVDPTEFLRYWLEKRGVAYGGVWTYPAG